jgi:hypothetical protein
MELVMAVISRRVSDVTGKEGNEDAFHQVTVRQHPKSEQAKRLDVLPGEFDNLKVIPDLVVLEVRTPGGDTSELYVQYADFVKVIPDEVVQSAAGTRGRPQGYRPGNGS